MGNMYRGTCRLNTHHALTLLALVSLSGTVWVGVWLRGWLAGVPLPLHDFSAIRHLHTHLGYYGVLFPLMWLAWGEQGIPTLRLRTVAVYTAATLLAAVGFGMEGYGLPAIVGSTVVLSVWLAAAWGARGAVRPGGGWLSTAPIAIAIGAALVPLVAKADDITRAQELVRTFLGLLLLGALLPTALQRIGARSLSGLAWLIAVVAGALSMGAAESPALSVGLLVLGVGVGVVALRTRLPLDLRLAWAVPAAGLCVVGSGLQALSQPIAVAGLHFIVLGPLLISLWPVPVPAALRGVILTILSGMCIAILVPGHAMLAAVLGGLLAVSWTGLCVFSHRLLRKKPPQ